MPGMGDITDGPAVQRALDQSHATKVIHLAGLQVPVCKADPVGVKPNRSAAKEQGATGITTVAPYIAGQWGRGNNRLPG